MPGIGFEPTISILEHPNTLHAADAAATVIRTVKRSKFS
jgi:hypothetical protein